MSDDPSDSLLVRAAGRPVLRAGRAIVRPPPWIQYEEAKVFGLRGIRHPGIAVRTIRQLGPVRHALAQRAVCGVIEVHAPFSPDGKETG